MGCRFASLDFDIAASAGGYSATADLFTGFALLAILLPLDHDSSQQDEPGGAGAAESVVIFTCAFFSLLSLGGVTYAILAGRTGVGAALGIALRRPLLLRGWVDLGRRPCGR